jgi:hypothetical protein
VGINLFGFESHDRPLGLRFLHATVVPTDDGQFLSTIEVEGESRIVYRRALRFTSCELANADLTIQLRFMNELSIEDLQRCAALVQDDGEPFSWHDHRDLSAGLMLKYIPQGSFSTWEYTDALRWNQPESDLNEARVAFYMEALQRGEKLPPIVVDGDDNNILDGHHKWMAARRLHIEQVPIKIDELGIEAAETEGEFDTHEPPSIGDVSPKLHYLSELLLTTVFVKRAGSTENYLQSIGAQPDVIQFLLQQPEDIAKKLVNEVRKNHTITVQKLQEMAQGLANKQKYEPTQRELILANQVSQGFSIPGMSQWVLLQAKKYRAKKVERRPHHPTPYKNFPPYEFEYNWPPIVDVLWAMGTLSYVELKLNQIADWVRATQVQIASFDLPSAVAASDKWHEEQAAEGAGQGYEEKNVVYTFKNGWTIQDVKTENDLQVEGNLMGHCVGSYCEQVGAGESTIFSLRDPQNMPHATIEVQGGAVVSSDGPSTANPFSLDSVTEPGWDITQIQGKQNQEPIPEYKAMIKEWFQSLGGGKSISMGGDQEEFGERMVKFLRGANPDDWADILWGQSDHDQNEYGLGRDEKVYEQYLREYNNNGTAAFDQLYTSIEEGLHAWSVSDRKEYGRRGDAFRHNPMGNIAAALADLAWDADLSRALKGHPFTPRGPGSSALTGIHKVMDRHQEEFDKVWMPGDTGLREDQFESEEKFFEAEQKIRDEQYLEWMPGGLDHAIWQRWNEKLKETRGLWPSEIAANVAEKKKPYTKREVGHPIVETERV